MTVPRTARVSCLPNVRLAVWKETLGARPPKRRTPWRIPPKRGKVRVFPLTCVRSVVDTTSKQQASSRRQQRLTRRTILPVGVAVVAKPSRPDSGPLLTQSSEYFYKPLVPFIPCCFRMGWRMQPYRLTVSLRSSSFFPYAAWRRIDGAKTIVSKLPWRPRFGRAARNLRFYSQLPLSECHQMSDTCLAQ